MTKGINIYSGLFNNIKVTSNKSKTESIHTSKDTINKTKRGTVRGLGGQKRLLSAWLPEFNPGAHMVKETQLLKTVL